MALQKMGSSVFHGGFSTFLAIFVLLPGQTYIFQSFFRLWFGIIVFGMSNGFILLPVLLSFFGPVDFEGSEQQNKVHNEKDKERESKETFQI